MTSPETDKEYTEAKLLRRKDAMADYTLIKLSKTSTQSFSTQSSY